MASPIESTWAQATILIETPSRRGTGFLVGRALNKNQNRWKIWIITNKHVLHPNPAERQAMKFIHLHINVEKAGVLVGEIVKYPLESASRKLWYEHPSADVDVLAINAAPLFMSKENLANKFVPEELFAVTKKRTELDITAGEEIIVVGYPSGIRQGKTNLPLIRQGILATRIGEELHEEVLEPSGKISTRVSRAFLIDGATIPGSSGSPVVLKPVTGRYRNDSIVLGATLPVLLGIVAETRYAPISAGEKTVLGFAGLGFAFDVETIIEVMDLF